MDKFKMSKSIFSLVAACIFTSGSTLVHAAPFSIPVGLLHYNPNTSGSYLFPQSGAISPICGENKPFARRYRAYGTVQGSDSWIFKSQVDQSADITLYERNGNGTAQIRIHPLGTQKDPSHYYPNQGNVMGNTCASSTNPTNIYAEKLFGKEGMVGYSTHLNTNNIHHYTLAFELLNPQSVAPGIYSARGGYQFRPEEIVQTSDTISGEKAAPYIPDLSIVIGHVFKIDMPYTSVSLTQSYQNNDVFTGKVRFRAQSNERYSITMTCSSSNAVTPENNCNFASTQMVLSTQARFPEQGRTFDLKHGIPTYIDGADFTGSYYENPREYPGYIDFALTGISLHGEAGKTYFDTVNLTFEADF